jgi:hypothetical protein
MSNQSVGLEVGQHARKEVGGAKAEPRNGGGQRIRHTRRNAAILIVEEVESTELQITGVDRLSRVTVNEDWK